eukprot:CAMPEP_0183326268 /NCGR_PEP_ID=MMETSP0160_2-20130417/81753_1 /TAXON_ID=2839 ORGANISM="Odontella Sinensis, Strain Grunow 1884" /NCGR_SAMPLE_ID=MMETSP0160_2 /ASSEMBLY_ACC=CAM_ASM_000250 /LENGTH=40 /DNA_ID= /DNA_START= /DNA_END= /DNA_ORIENTATION=
MTSPSDPSTLLPSASVPPSHEKFPFAFGALPLQPRCVGWA